MIDPRKLTAFTVEFCAGEDGYVIAACKDIPGCISQGKTRDEALANVSDAIEGCLEIMWEDWKSRVEQAPTTDLGVDRVSLELCATLRQAG